MRLISPIVMVSVCTCLAGTACRAGEGNMDRQSYIDSARMESTVGLLVDAKGEEQRGRIEKGVEQAARFWREEDGTPGEFSAFCEKQFIADPDTLRMTAGRYETMLESVSGHMREMGRDLSWNVDVETGTLLPVDYLFAEYSPGAHFNDDMFRSKIAFVCLLNFPLYSLEERLRLGPEWSRQEWAETRLAETFSARVPAEVSQKLTQAYVAADNYINEYNIYMHHVITPGGERLFPEGMRLVTHWNLRDELKGRYSDPDGLAKQELIYQVMSKIIRQEIPAAVIDNPAVDWKISTGEVTVSPVVDGDIPSEWESDATAGAAVNGAREPDTRYARLLGVFRAERGADLYYPLEPTKMDRRFQRDREIPEKEVEALFHAVLSSDALAGAAKLIARRLGRDLRPFDIWYNGFEARGSWRGEELDRIVGEMYPTVEAFQDDIPNLLGKLGFTPEAARYLSTKIVIDPSRGIGHAMSPGRRSDKAHLRTRVGREGMNYKGYNIAIHEFGHNVEQVFSLDRVDHTLLRGVPNTAFTEGFAFVFQSRDLELLGLARRDTMTAHLNALDNLWSTAEIAAVALVDMGVWHWMYDHQDATPAELREAVTGIAKDVWNRYYAPLFGVKDVDLLVIYSHMIDAGLYLPDYPLGHIIAFQVEEFIERGDLAAEMERMCTIGSITPDRWMQQAVGGAISAEPMIRAAEKALRVVGN